MKSRTCILLPFLFLILIVPAFSQEGMNKDAAGSLVFASGQGFQIIRDGVSEEYDVSADSVTGLELYRGDYINTFQNTFLEIELSGSGHLMKISENTSFRFKPAKTTDVNSFLVDYGRIRARVKKLAGLEQFTIDGPSVVAGVRGTDFGYDVIYPANAMKPVSAVYCFEGSVEVSQKVSFGSATGFKEDEARDLIESTGTSLILLANEMLMIEGKEAEAGQDELFSIEKTSVSNEIENFWNQNDFIVGEVKESETQPVVMKDVEQDTQPRISFTKAQLRRGALVLGGIGTVFGAAAATFYYADPLVGGMRQDLRDQLTLSLGVSGSIFLGTSIMIFVGSLFSD